MAGIGKMYQILICCRGIKIIIGYYSGISSETVKRHIENLLSKTGYKNRIDLAVNAKMTGLVVHDDL